MLTIYSFRDLRKTLVPVHVSMFSSATHNSLIWPYFVVSLFSAITCSLQQSDVVSPVTSDQTYPATLAYNTAVTYTCEAGYYDANNANSEVITCDTNAKDVTPTTVLDCQRKSHDYRHLSITVCSLYTVSQRPSENSVSPFFSNYM